MRTLLWIPNGGLLVLLFFAGTFVYFSRQQPPNIVSIKPADLGSLIDKEDSQVDISAIYENDLFGTYHKKTLAEPVKTEQEISPIPAPPTPKPVIVPKDPEVQFKPPLKITLSGTIVFNDDSENRAFITDEKTKESNSYKEGDTIEDAQIIRIFHNKIVLIRSNGQQETLYLDAEEAKLEAELDKKSWGHVARKDSENNFSVDPEAFITAIHSLGQLIDLLNITSVYKQGKNIGCRIGKYPEYSIAPSIGFAVGDILSEINGIEVSTSSNRVKIYNNIRSMNTGDKISIKLKRSGSDIELTYTLAKLEQPKGIEKIEKIEQGNEEIIILGKKSKEQIRREKIEILKSRHKLAPTLEELHKREKRNIINAGSRDLRKRLGL